MSACMCDNAGQCQYGSTGLLEQPYYQKTLPKNPKNFMKLKLMLVLKPTLVLVLIC